MKLFENKHQTLNFIARQNLSNKLFKPFTPQMGRIRMALGGKLDGFYTIPSQSEINKMLASISSKVDVQKYAPNIKSRLFDYEKIRKEHIMSQ